VIDRGNPGLAVPLVDDHVAGQQHAELGFGLQRLVGEWWVAGAEDQVRLSLDTEFLAQRRLHMHMPTWLGAIPGVSALATRMMQRQMEKIDIPLTPAFIELVHDSGVRLYACKASVDMFGLTMDDFVPQVEEIISVGEFYEKAAGGQVIFTSTTACTRLDAPTIVNRDGVSGGACSTDDKGGMR
jgi:peroxiredoxin family protein